jgi:putative DNA primase/helicase
MGTVSENAECLDYDEISVYRALVDFAEAAGLADVVERIEAGYLEETPSGGRHWVYRCETIDGNTKLASRPKRPEEMEHDKDKTKTLIETRGERGYIVADPSNGRVHSSGKPYRQLRGGVATIAMITPEERSELFALARSLDQMPKEEPREARTATAGGG